MSTYARYQLLLENSDYSDYLQSDVHRVVETQTPAQSVVRRRLLVDTGTVTVELGNFNTVTSLVIANLDTAIACTAAFNTAAGAVTMVIPASEFVKLVDIGVAADLQLTMASGSGSNIDVSILGT